MLMNLSVITTTLSASFLSRCLKTSMTSGNLLRLLIDILLLVSYCQFLVDVVCWFDMTSMPSL